MAGSGSMRIPSVCQEPWAPGVEEHERTARAAFPPTDWSVVLNAGGTSRDALERLCRLHWPAVYRYLRAQRYSRDDALDLTQSFFTWLIAQDDLRRFGESDALDKQRRRFRPWLIHSLGAFLSRARARAERAATKRAVGLDWLSPRKPPWWTHNHSRRTSNPRALSSVRGRSAS